MKGIRLKRIIIPAVLLLVCITGLLFSGFKTAKAESTPVPVTYEADFSNGLPYDWMLYGRGDTTTVVTPSVTNDGALKLGSNNGSLLNYYGVVYRFATDLGNVTDFTLEFEYKVTSQRDTGRWIGLLYHTNLTNTKWLSGYGMGFRVDGRNHQTTIAHNSSSSTIKFTDSQSNAAISPKVSWNDYHKLIVKAEGNTVSHYFDSTDNLLCTYDITSPEYADALSPQKYGGFALIMNFCEIEIKSVKIDALRDPQYNAKVPGDNNTALTDYNTVGLKSQTAVISYITSAEDVTALSTNGAVSSIFHLKSGTNKFYGKNGAELSTPTLAELGAAVLAEHSSGRYPKYNGTYPIVYVDDAQGGETLTHYLSTHFANHSQTIQLAMMTADANLLKSMRTTFNRVRGMLDLSASTIEKTPAAWQNVVETTHGALGTTVVLSEEDATPEAVDYIQKRGITVWVKQANYNTVDTASIMASGAGGIISTNVPTTVSACSVFANDINALTRAPLNIAHRGMSMGYYPNSLEGCKASIATGATHVEIDLYVTTDNEIVVMHDDPLYVSTNCDHGHFTSDLTLAQVREHLVTKESNEFLFPATVLGQGVQIPTLDEMFEWAKTDPNALFYLELKPCDAGHGGGGTLEQTYNQRLIDKIAELIEEYDIANQVMFITSSSDLAIKAQAKMPGIALISTAGDNILANNNYYLEYWATINGGIDVNSGWANTPEFLALGYLPNYWTYVIEHYIREGGYPVYLNYEAAIISGVYGITNNYPFVFKNNAYRLYNDNTEVSVANLSSLYANGVQLKYETYGHQIKDVNATIATFAQKDGYAEATFKATFTNDYGLKYTLYTPKYKINFTSVDTESVVTFDANGGVFNGEEQITIPSGSTIPAPTAPTKAGFAFDGWTLNGKPFNFDVAIYGDVTLVASWSMQVSFDANGGTLKGDAGIKVIAGQKITKPEDPYRNGYLFAGWTLNGTAFDFNTPITEGITLVANWETFSLSNYVYKTELDGTKSALSSITAVHSIPWNSILVDVGNYISVIDNYMQNNGLDFIQFDNSDFITYTDAAGNDKLFSVRFREKFLFVNANDNSYVVGDILTIKAGFVWGDYQVKKDLTFVVKGLDQGLQYQAQLDYTDITISGLHVDKNSTWGWPSIQVIFNGVSGATFAQYQNCLDTMIIEFHTADGTAKPLQGFIEITGAHDGSRFIIRLEDQQYVFTNGDTVSIYKNSYISVGEKAFRLTKDYHFVVDSAYSGGYKVRTCAVTFDANGGTLTGATVQNVNYNEKISAPSNPTRGSDAQYTYTFNGWKLNGVAFDFNTAITENITLVADWTATKNTYTVTFDTNGGTPVEAQIVAYGETATEPVAPTLEGYICYIFKGWTLDGDEYDFSTPVTENITLVATWEEIPAPAPAPEEKGCGSALVGTLIPSAIAILAAGAVIVSKKKRK